MLNKKEQKTYVGIDEKYGKLYMRNLLISLVKKGCFWLFFFILMDLFFDFRRG